MAEPESGQSNESAIEFTRVPIVGVSRRFSVAHMMVGVGLFAVMFSLLQGFGVGGLQSPGIVYIPCIVFCLAIPLAQAFLYQGREPRKASCLVGMRLLPLLAVGATVALLFEEFSDRLRFGLSNPQMWGTFLLIIAIEAVLSLGVGYLLGYAVGAISAGVFLVLDRKWDAGKRIACPSNTAERVAGASAEVGTIPPTGKWWLDWLAWSPAAWLWKGRHKPWRTIFFATSIVGVLFFVSLLITLQVLPTRYWLVHLTVAVIATPLIGVTLSGLPHAGRRVPVVFCVLGMIGSIYAFYLLTQTWIWSQVVPHIRISSLRHWDVENVAVAAAIVIVVVITGAAPGLVAAGFYGWARVLLCGKEKPTGLPMAVVLAAGLIAVMAVCTVGVMLYVDSPRERAIRGILADGAFIQGRSPFSVDSVFVSGGPASADLFEHIGALTEVQDLTLHLVSVTGDEIRHLGRLTNLAGLRFDQCNFAEGALPKLPPMPSLSRLCFENCRLTANDLEMLQSCPSLIELTVSGERLEANGFRHLPELDRLVRISLSDTEIRGELCPYLRQIPEVSLVDVPISDEDLSHLAGAAEIRCLSIDGSSISDAGFRHLGNLNGLETLSIQSAAISGTGLADLKDLKTLTSLDLGGTAVDDEGLAHLPPLPGLTFLSLRGTKITAKGLGHLKRLPNLRQLDLGDCIIGNEALEPLRELTLTRLVLHWAVNMSDGVKEELMQVWNARLPNDSVWIESR